MNLKQFISEDQKTLKINIKLKAKRVKDEYDCTGCYFDPNPNGCDKMLCCKSERKDGKNVIWIEDK